MHIAACCTDGKPHNITNLTSQKLSYSKPLPVPKTLTTDVGQPMQGYLIARRMEEAALMFESENDALARIATHVGYETTSAFSKVFRRHHGLSPGRYRAAHKGIGVS